MESNLIPITTASFGETKQQGVNARDLHAFLEIGKDFATWIKDRIVQFDFIEGVDFVKTQDLSSPNLGNAKSRAQIRIEYLLTLNMAKELSMVERNEKGKQARQYFIQCERQLKEITNPKFQIPQTLSEALRLAADLADKNLALESKAKEDAPKVAFTEDVIATGAEMTITAAAKVLGMAPRKFFDWLRIGGYLYLQSNQATQRSIDSGWMVVRFAQILRADGIEQKAYPHVTGKGLYFFYTRLIKLGVIARNQSLELAV